jgi:hypothetical protein
MVAASGGEGALGLRTAWMLLGTALLGVAIVVGVAPVANELGLAPPEKSPDVLVDHSREIIRKSGYKDPPHDAGFWFTRNYGFLNHRARKLPKSQPFGDLKSAEQSPVRFFYRQSPRNLFPGTFGNQVGYFDPEMNVSGMVMTAMEQTGALVFFEAVPPQLMPKSRAKPEAQAAAAPPPSTAPADWPLFAESRLDPSRFEPEPPIWLPPVPFDTIAGWHGSYA